ncbi:MAG: pilus assembly protein PilM, partial [Fimbriimonadaceae bacterium]|nr:pilus assembly protein PilM [Fimbriimonadaceae bacterium]
MAKKAKKYGSVVGIDIGSQNIKVAEIASRGREYVINALGIAPTPEGLVDQNGVYDTETIGAVVKDLCQKSGVSVSNAVVSIAGQAAILVRTLEVPKMSESELKQHMEWEISRNQPFAELTVQSDYAAFEPTDPNAQNMDVIMAIAAQSAVDTIMGIGKKGGKQVVAIDVEPLAVART